MKKRLIIYIFLIVFLLSGGTFIIKTGLIKSIVLDASYPFIKSVAEIKEFFDFLAEMIRSQKDLIQQNKKLQQEVEILKAQIIYLKNIENENKNLKKMLNFVKERSDFSFKAGKIIGYSPDSWNGFVIINLGSMDGIKKGDIVVANGYLFGEVYQVGAFSSSVILTSDKNFMISARCRKTREAVFYRGKNTKEGKLLYVKPDQDIRIGDIVETAGFESGIPEGIPIGTVKSISYDEGNFYKDVSVSLSLNPLEIEYVIVLSRKETGKK
ncbi:rod shape-determining protein MreC [Persephonella sp.]|uniref:rod shape-determining protein MreC n=1 Tax=Persephonella sp. TaxID=2060922 RepID=UPI0025FB34FF|nr:rod shape-determining protein MreC [Persephonella sp.]